MGSAPVRALVDASPRAEFDALDQSASAIFLGLPHALTAAGMAGIALLFFCAHRKTVH